MFILRQENFLYRDSEKKKKNSSNEQLWVCSAIVDMLLNWAA